MKRLRAGALEGAGRLELRGGLRELPREILQLADSLDVLDVSGNELKQLPDWLPELRRLRVIFASQNPFECLPEVLGECAALRVAGFRACRITRVDGAALPRQLESLILTDNHLAALPRELGGCRGLKKLMLSGNRLAHLPEALQSCSELEMLRLAANDVRAFPAWLWQMPALAWVAVAGNPGTEFPSTRGGEGDAMRHIPWQEIRLGPLLGQGASGMIHAAEWTTAGGGRPQSVAVKLFKGTMTSDGLPASEAAASVIAGEHPALPGTLGRLTGHPDKTDGLILRLIGPALRPLAAPPSLTTCTRDVYASDTTFSADEVRTLLHSVASAAHHLHQRGLLHGDLYAHNVLHAPGGATLLSDFGAASCYPSGHAALIQRVEVRAFGILMEEVLSRCTEMTSLSQSLTELAARCTQADVAARPDFAAVIAVLTSC